MRKLLLLLCSLSAFAQTAKFPGAVATDSQLMVVANRVETKLTASVASGDTVAAVANPAGIVANMLVTMDSEIAQVCGIAGNLIQFGKTSCPNVDGRGFDGTSAGGHAANVKVSAYIDAWHHNAVAAEVKSIENTLGAKLLPTGGNPFPVIDWRRTPGTIGVASTVDNYWQTGIADGRAYIASIYSGAVRIGHLFSTTGEVGSTAQQAFGLAGYVRLDNATSAGVALFGLCEANTNSAVCFGANPIAASPPGITAKLVGAEIDVEPSLGSPTTSGSSGLYINGFNETIQGAQIQTGAVQGGIFTNGIGINGVTESGTALFPVGHATVTINNVVNNGFGLCRISFTTAPNDINTGQHITTVNIAGATGCNGNFVANRIGTNLLLWDLVGTTFGGAYTSGGTATRTWDFDSFFNLTPTMFRTDAIQLGPQQGIRFYNVGLSSYGRIYSDPVAGNLVFDWSNQGGIAFSGLAANLPTNGMMTYCNNCTVASPCAGGGTGAIAKRLNGNLVCN